MADYIHYWAPERLRLAFEGREGPITAVASGWYHTLLSTDVLWLLGRDEHDSPVLAARLEVASLPRLLAKPPVYAVGNSRFFDSYSVNTKSGRLTAIPVSWRDLGKLRFDSTVDRLKSSGVRAFAEGLASMRRLTVPSAQLLQSVWNGSSKRTRSQPRASLFSDPDSDRLVERAAVAYVTKAMTDKGWTVRSVEALNPGYDLECTRGADAKHIEVKGRSSADRSFALTRNEFEQPRSDPDYEFWIVSEIEKKPTVWRFAGSLLRKRCILEPLNYIAAPSKS